MLPPTPFAIQSLSVFAAGLPDELLLCPVRTLSEYVAKTSRFVDRPRRLFVSSCSSSRALSNNGFSYLLREVLVHSGASSNDVAALMTIVFVALRHLPFFGIGL